MQHVGRALFHVSSVILTLRSPPSLSPLLRFTLSSPHRVPCSVFRVPYYTFHVSYSVVPRPRSVLLVICWALFLSFLAGLWVLLLMSVGAASGCGGHVRAAGDHRHRRKLLLRESIHLFLLCTVLGFSRFVPRLNRRLGHSISLSVFVF